MHYIEDHDEPACLSVCLSVMWWRTSPHPGHSRAEARAGLKGNTPGSMRWAGAVQDLFILVCVIVPRPQALSVWVLLVLLTERREGEVRVAASVFARERELNKNRLYRYIFFVGESEIHWVCRV